MRKAFFLTLFVLAVTVPVLALWSNWKREDANPPRRNRLQPLRRPANS